MRTFLVWLLIILAILTMLLISLGIAFLLGYKSAVHEAEAQVSALMNVTTVAKSKILNHCKTLRDSVMAYAVLYATNKVSPSDIYDIANKETQFHNVRGNIDEIGVMQVRPITAEFVGIDSTMLWDIEFNVIAAVRYIEFCKDIDSTNWAAVYNGGPGGKNTREAKTYAEIYWTMSEYCDSVFNSFWKLAVNGSQYSY